MFHSNLKWGGAVEKRGSKRGEGGGGVGGYKSRLATLIYLAGRSSAETGHHSNLAQSHNPSKTFRHICNFLSIFVCSGALFHSFEVSIPNLELLISVFEPLSE